MNIKKLSLFFAVAAAFASEAPACTNIIVGKAASEDGSVFVSYNADSYGRYGDMYYHAGGTHAAGEMREIREGDTGKLLGSIPQAPHTYRVVGQMNEKQVSITETTFGGREELMDTTGIIDYTSLMSIALERAATAREAISVMTSLVAEYGYYSEGETFSICDKNEAWIMEMIGRGPGAHAKGLGPVWVAIRVPDNCICVHANQSRITRFNMKDRKNVLWEKDIIRFAREKGFFAGKDAEFSFRDAYSPNDFSATRYCDARVWSIMNLFCDGMDKYLEYAKGNDMKGEMPLFAEPNRLLSLEDVMAGMRDHYEGTPLQIQGEIGSGPYDMPYRPTPLAFESDGKKYFNERPVSTQQTAFCFIGVMRSWKPDDVGGIMWWTADDSNMAPFTPIYCSVDSVPLCYRQVTGVQDDMHFSWNSAFWVQNTVSNMVYPYYCKMYPDLRKAKDSLEDLFKAYRIDIEDEAIELIKNGNQKEARHILTRQSEGDAILMMEGWKNLFEYIVVKHNDMAVKKTDENDRFLDNGNNQGYAAPVIRPGYPEDFRRRIVSDNGERYAMPK